MTYARLTMHCSPSVASFLGLSSFYPFICVMYYCERTHKHKSKNGGDLGMKLRYQAMKPMTTVTTTHVVVGYVSAAATMNLYY